MAMVYASVICGIFRSMEYSKADDSKLIASIHIKIIPSRCPVLCDRHKCVRYEVENFA